MPRQTLFAVRLKNFEPHSLRTGKNQHKFGVKRRLREAILEEAGAKELQYAKSRIGSRRLALRVRFYLWKGAENISDTRSKKDLDNLLKPVLDVLQSHIAQGVTESGLGLIEDDSQIWRIEAEKELVDDEEDEGIHILVLDRESRA